MAARAALIGDTGENSPENWEKPLGTPEVHIVLTAVAPDAQHLEVAFERARTAHRDLNGVKVIWRQDCYALPSDKEPFGFRDGMSYPAIEGSGIPGTNPGYPPLKAANSFSAIPMSSESYPQFRSPEFSAVTARILFFASYTNGWPRSANILR